MWAQGAIALLGTRNDPLANSLRLDAINKRDRRNAAIDYFEIYCGPDQVTGYFMTSIASWLAEAKGVDAAEALLAKATPTTAGEPNAALHADANAACTSGSETDASRAVKNQSLLPAPGTLRNDTEGRRLNAEARADAERLLDDVRDHPNAYFAELVELTRQYLGLVSGDPAIVEESKKAIGDYMADPETRTPMCHSRRCSISTSTVRRWPPSSIRYPGSVHGITCSCAQHSISPSCLKIPTR